jgi:hypothetical protein
LNKVGYHVSEDYTIVGCNSMSIAALRHHTSNNKDHNICKGEASNCAYKLLIYIMMSMHTFAQKCVDIMS